MIASMSKQFTAMCIMILAEEGVLKPNDFINQYFPDFPSGDQITLHHLLTQSSGLPPGVFLNRGTTLQERIELGIEDHLFKLYSEPGEKYEYSDVGYILLNAVIEKVSGLTYEEFLQESILNPLVTDETLNQMFTDYGFGNGYGFFIKELDDETKYVSPGGMLLSKTFTGFSVCCPDKDIIVIILGNDQNHDDKRTLAKECLDIVMKGLDKD